MFRTLTKLTLALAAVGFTFTIIATWIALGVVEGRFVPATIYAVFRNQSALLPLVREHPLDLLIQPRPEVAEMRDLAFALFNIRPEARDYLKGLPLTYGDPNGLAGSFDPNSGQVTIGRHSPYTFLHEYAHANFQRKPLIEKMGFLQAVWELWNSGNGHHVQAREVLGQELATSIDYAQSGKSYNPVLEFYAHLAEVSEGDLSAIPEPLRQYYADYLQSGSNQWMRYQVSLGTPRTPVAHPA